MILSKDIDDHRILQPDWTRGTTDYTQPKVVVPDANFVWWLRCPSRMRFHLGEIAPVYEETFVSSHMFWGEISPQGDFASVLKTGAKFHPGANSVWFQRVTAISFNPGLILWAMLWLIQKMLSHYHYFLCSNNWYNVQIASSWIFLKDFTLKEGKTEKNVFSMKKMRH